MADQDNVDRSGVATGCGLSFLAYVAGWALGFSGIPWTPLMVFGVLGMLGAGLALAASGRSPYARGAGTGVLISLGIATVSSGACFACFAAYL